MHMEQEGWKLTAADQGWHVYENPLKTDLFYLSSPSGRTVSVEKNAATFGANRILLRLSPQVAATELTATFLYLPGWHAYVDGKRREIYSADDRLMRINIFPGDRRVLFIFQPFFWYHFAACAALSLAIPFIFYLKTRKRKSFAGHADEEKARL